MILKYREIDTIPCLTNVAESLRSQTQNNPWSFWIVVVLVVIVVVWSQFGVRSFFFFSFVMSNKQAFKCGCKTSFAEMAKGLAVQNKHLRHDRHYAVGQFSADMYKNVWRQCIVDSPRELWRGHNGSGDKTTRLEFGDGKRESVVDVPWNQ